MPKRLSVLFGTRPEAIKLCPLVLELRKSSALQTEVCSTGQHRQMLDQVLGLFGVQPDVELNLMTSGQSLAGFTARALEQVDAYLERSKPDLVILQGDTSTVLAASLACFYRKIPTAHVEAGLRSFDLHHPFPEELNRLMATRVASLHFAPTTTARENLLREGVSPSNVFVTGNTVIDALHFVRQQNQSQPPHIPEIPSLPAQYLLVTGHRRENFGQGMVDLCTALLKLAEQNPDLHLLYPVHLNPNVQEPVRKLLSGQPRIHLLPPVDYTALVYLLEGCQFVLTDSGGIQEEAPAFGKPVLVMREKTERPEGVEAGTARLVGTSPERIVGEATRLLTDSEHYRSMATAHNPFGDGTACRQIRQHLEVWANA
ncbi:MAG: UDP-N-acetylglucosamine 2-epimerase (non-hydrolyzing) [Candidatus Sumerlaeia bacterium]|nr:UDP-N-acetylglucosamine 2-epimerase (non-hydrolyzing) [Candidatus Sumerlaeia bacterium]